LQRELRALGWEQYSKGRGDGKKTKKAWKHRQFAMVSNCGHASASCENGV